MSVTINYSEKIYQKGHPARNLSDFLIENPVLIDVLCEINNLRDKAYKSSTPKANLDSIIGKSLKLYSITKRIPFTLTEKLLSLWEETSNENIGVALEILIAKSGPYGSELKDYDFSCDVKVEESESESNLDVVFFDKLISRDARPNDKLIVGEFAEFHECKKNICNEIPVNKNKPLKKSMANKLTLIKDTKKLLPKGKFFIATFYSNVSPQEDYLKDIECEFIEILSLPKLKERYFAN